MFQPVAITHNDLPQAIIQLQEKLNRIEQLLIGLSSSSRQHPGELYTTAEVTALLKISKSTLVKLRKKGLPVISIEGSIRYDPQEAVSFVKRQGQRGGAPG